MSDDEDRPDPEQERQRVTDRLRDADMPTQRFIDIRDGEKGTWTSGHQQPENQVEPDDPRLDGNYGTHPGRHLIEIDIDDYDDECDTRALDALPETLTVEIPHMNGRRIDEKPTLSDLEEWTDAPHFACPTCDRELDPGPHGSWQCWHCDETVIVRGGDA